MERVYYYDSIMGFLSKDNNYIFKEIVAKDEFRTTDLQKNAWKTEINILKKQLSDFSEGEIAFEYTIPRIGHRIDVVLLIKGVIFLLEFKVGDNKFRVSTNDQVIDYALDLKYFHEKSLNRYIVPISVATEAETINNKIEYLDGKILSVLKCNKRNIGQVIRITLGVISDDTINMCEWINSRYNPTPTIIEAAKTMYRNHNVEDICRNDVGIKNITETTEIIGRVIDNCKLNNHKAICFVTGVPGAGKTLVGLNVANSRLKNTEEHAVFLSGNLPLVAVLQEALAKDKRTREGTKIGECRRETKAFIQIIHKFRDELLTTKNAPVEKVAVFDEAQRVWDQKELSLFMKKKKGIDNFDKSEPDFLIECMDRHKDWAVIVCLVGGGQEINRGESGIGEWFKSLKEKYLDWDIYISDKINEAEYVGDSSLNAILEDRSYITEPALHLGTSVRSFRSEKLSGFVKTLLDNKPHEARQFMEELVDKYPICVTRNLSKAKEWVRKQAKGTERYGIIASSQGKRLRADGLNVSSDMNYVKWFLEDKTCVDSSYFLEEIGTEFQLQGLELEYSLLAWDGDLRREDNDFSFFQFKGSGWQKMQSSQKQKFLKNAYRVLLTRARQGMVIYVPVGADKEDDITRDKDIYNGIYEYLISCGVKELD